MNKKFWVKKIVGFIVLAIAMTAVLGYVVMLLWNNVLTAVVSVTAITFWQALGLFILSKILFGGFKGGGCWGCHKGGQWKNEMKEKWHSMTPEEREKIKQEWRNRCGVWKRNASDQSAGTE
jgi:hypothetical protein